VNGINFRLPTPAATAGTSQGLQSPVQSSGFWSGVPSGAASSGGQTGYAAQAAPAAQSPVKVGGFYFGVPSVAGVATQSSAPSSVPQTAPPSPSTPTQGLWPQGFASFTPASAVQPGTQQPEQRSGPSSPTPGGPPQELWPQGFTPLAPASAVQPGKQQSEQQQQQGSSPSTPDPATPPQLVRGIWPQGFTPIIPPSPVPAQPVSQPHEQQQQSSAVDSKLKQKIGGGKDLSVSGLRKMRTGFGMETVLADLDTDEGPLLSSAAAAASQSDQAASQAGAAQLVSADVGTTHVSLKSSQEVAVDRHPVPVSTILADFLQAYSDFVRQPFAALRIAHQSRAVERSQWGLSFSQLAWGTEVVLEVEFSDAPVATPASPTAAIATSPIAAAVTPASATSTSATSTSPAAAVTPAAPAVKASVPEQGSTAGAVPADSTSNSTPSVHLTVTRAGAKPVSGSVPTATKLGELLAEWAQGQGLALEALQVFYQGKHVDRAWWGRSFAELGCGSSLVLEVQVQAHQQPVADADADAGPAQQPEAVTQGEQQAASQLWFFSSMQNHAADVRVVCMIFTWKSFVLNIFLSDDASTCRDPASGAHSTTGAVCLSLFLKVSITLILSDCHASINDEALVCYTACVAAMQVMQSRLGTASS